MDPSNLTVAFGIWAAVVGLTGGAIVYELSRMRSQVSDLADRMQTLTVHFEHRLTKVETAILAQLDLGRNG